jgi:2-polyprenyl-3-methyl-5-hydroxy-6-metoxy-1,4-benzoquinol methylase
VEGEVTKAQEMRRIFAKIHEAKAWGDVESASGPGSTRERAATFLPDLIALVRRLGVATLLDAPCGDFNWAQPLADAVTHYVGVDVVASLIETNQRVWASPSRTFVCADIVSDPLPHADLILCRDGLVHLCDDDALAALGNFRLSGAAHVILTTFIGDRSNTNIANGEWRPLNMQRPPFSLPPPVALIDEHCHHTGGIYADKRLGLWRGSDLPAR